jgi:ferredoxin
MRVLVDFGLCQGHGSCAADAPEVFGIDEKRGVVIVREERPAEALRAKVETAVKFCPTRALRLEEQ